MSCEECVRALSEGRVADAAQHGLACRFCAALLPGQDAPMSGAITKRLRSALPAEFEAVRPLPGNAALGARVVIVVAAVTIALLLVFGAEGHSTLQAGDRAGLYSALAAGTVGLSAMVARLAVPGAAISRWHWVVLAALAGFVAWVPLRFNRYDYAQWWQAGVACLLLGSAWGMVTCAAVLAALRRTYLSGMRLGAVAGLLGGCAGLTGLTLHCSLQEPTHVLIWHLGAMAIPMAAGIAVLVWLRKKRQAGGAGGLR